MKAEKLVGIALLVFLVTSLLVSCANSPVVSTVNIGDGDCRVRICAKVGPIGKTNESTRKNTRLEIEMRRDTIVTDIDIFDISSGSTGIFRDYELDSVSDWYATGLVYDENDSLTHRSVPKLVNVSSGEHILSIPAIITFLQVRFKSTEEMREAILYVDNVPRDTFNITFAGDTVVLDYFRLSASPSGIFHQIGIRVSGDAHGFVDVPLYTGDVGIIAISGESPQAPLTLWYVGPEGPEEVPLRLEVQIGLIGNSTFNGALESSKIIYEPYNDSLFSASTGITKVLSFRLFTGDSLDKKLPYLDMESENEDINAFCSKAYLVCNADTVEGGIPPLGEVIQFRNTGLVFQSRDVFDLLLDLKVGVIDSTRLRCSDFRGETLKGFRIKGSFSNGKQSSDWSSVVSVGN